MFFSQLNPSRGKASKLDQRARQAGQSLVFLGLILISPLSSAIDLEPFPYDVNALLVPSSERCHIHAAPNPLEKSYAEYLDSALEACEQAASSGNSEAQYLLADIYRLGLFIPKDQDKAIQLYQQASSKGHGKAQYQLASILLKGEGLRPDATQAFIMMRLSALNGYDQALNASDRIATQLDHEQRNAAFMTLSKVFKSYHQRLQEELMPSARKSDLPH